MRAKIETTSTLTLTLTETEAKYLAVVCTSIYGSNPIKELTNELFDAITESDVIPVEEVDALRDKFVERFAMLKNYPV